MTSAGASVRAPDNEEDRRRGRDKRGAGTKGNRGECARSIYDLPTCLDTVRARKSRETRQKKEKRKSRHDDVRYVAPRVPALHSLASLMFALQLRQVVLFASFWGR